MVQNPSEANTVSASEIPRSLCNRKVHYPIHNSPPTVPVLSQINPVPAQPSHFLLVVYADGQKSRNWIAKCYNYVWERAKIILTHSTQHSPSWKPNRFSANQEIPPHFMEPEGSLPHSQVPTTCPYPDPPQSSPHPHIQLPEDPFIHLLPSTPGSPKWSPSLRFPHQIPVYASPLPHTRYMPHPSHSSRFYNPNNICWALQIIKLFIM